MALRVWFWLVLVAAILLGSRVLNERLLLRHLGGMTLIAVGLTLVDGRIGRRLRPAE